MNIEYIATFVINIVLNDFIKNHLKSQSHTNNVCNRQRLNYTKKYLKLIVFIKVNCAMNVSDNFDNFTDLCFTNKCTNNEDNIDLNLPTLLLTIPCGPSLL